MEEPGQSSPEVDVPVKRVGRRVGGFIAFGTGAAIAVGAVVLLRDNVGAVERPWVLVRTALLLGGVAVALQTFGAQLMQGKTFNEAAGVDPTQKTSKVILIAASTLFLPCWLGCVVAMVKNAISFNIGGLLVAFLIGLVVTAFLAWMVREWRR